MARRRKPRVWTVLFLGALCYLALLPAAYHYAEYGLGCCRYGYCGGGSRLKRTPAQATRSAVMLFVADNPGRCPTVEKLVAERYLPEWNAGDVEVHCEDGDIWVEGPEPSPLKLRTGLSRALCHGLRSAAKLWALPFRVMLEGWRAAARFFV